MKIWSCYGKCYFAPLWHTLYPNSHFFEKPGKFATVLTHYLYMIQAYPMIKARLLTTKADPNLLPRHRVAVQDIQFLFEFALPTV